MQLVPRRIIFLFIVIFGLFWILFSRSASKQPPIPTYASAVGFHAPAFSLETMTGETISLTDYSGTPVILNFWASWCPPCRAEMPALQAVYADYQSKVGILAINASNQDSLPGAREIQSTFLLTFPILMDYSGSIQEIYSISSLPTTFFIDSEGIIDRIEIGGPLTESTLRIWIEKILEDKP